MKLTIILMFFISISNNLYPNLPSSRPIKLTEKHRLPCPQLLPSAFDNNRQRAPNQARFNMRRRIALRMLIIITERNHLIQFFQNIRNHTGISALVNRHASSRMGHKHTTDSIFNPAFINSLFN